MRLHHILVCGKPFIPRHDPYASPCRQANGHAKSKSGDTGRSGNSNEEEEGFNSEEVHGWFISWEDIRICRNAEGYKCRLGEGGFGIVYKAHMNGVDEVAVKLVKADQPSAREMALFHKEVSRVGLVGLSLFVRMQGLQLCRPLRLQDGRTMCLIPHGRAANSSSTDGHDSSRPLPVPGRHACSTARSQPACKHGGMAALTSSALWWTPAHCSPACGCAAALQSTG